MLLLIPVDIGREYCTEYLSGSVCRGFIGKFKLKLFVNRDFGNIFELFCLCYLRVNVSDS